MRYSGQPYHEGDDGRNSLLELRSEEALPADHYCVAYHQHRSSSAEQAAYLRISGIPAEVFGLWQKGHYSIWRVTVPETDRDRAEDLLHEFHVIARDDADRVMQEARVDRFFTNVIWWKGFPLEFRAWLIALSRETGTDRREEALCAFACEGEPWERYRGHLQETYDTRGWHGTGTSGFFTEDYSDLTDYPATVEGVRKVKLMLDALVDRDVAERQWGRIKHVVETAG